ncbi:MAG: exo-alpha-sialidase [Chloroflexi bacterium]|nr:exo-alpha-sialidase [Chloroflexota bacterium]
MVRRLVLLVTFALCLGVSLLSVDAPAASAADDERWSTPFPVSGPDPRAGGWFPSIAVDPSGRVHIVWNGRAPQRPAATSMEDSQRASDAAGWLIYASLNGQRWTPPNEIAAIGDEGDALRSSLTTDQYGKLHMLYRGLNLREPVVGGAENEPIRYASVNVQDGTKPNAWSAGIAISHHKPAYFSDIVTDSQGSLHALMTEPGDDKQYAPYYRRSDDGGRTWSSPVAIETALAVSRWRLQLKLGQNDDLHAVWEVVDPEDPSSRVPVGFVYARSTDRGATWKTTTFAPAKAGVLYPKQFEGTRWRVQPAVGVDGRGQIVLVWREYETDTVYFQRSNDGQTWSPPARIGGIVRGVARPFDRYDMATDSAGRLHLVAVAYTSASTTTMSLVHLEWLGYSWANPEIITRASIAPFPEWPRVAVGEGNRLHVAWFGGSSASVDRVPTGIWYSSKVTSAPHVAPVALPDRAAPQPDTANPALLVPTPVAPAPTVGQASGQWAGEPLAPAESLQPSPWPVVAGIVGSTSVLALLFVARRFLVRR